VQSRGKVFHPVQGSLTHVRGRSLEAAPGGGAILRRRGQRFERPLVYFRFTPDEFILSVAGSEETFVSTPHVAVEKRTRRVKAIGPGVAHCADQDVLVENGFRVSGGLIISDVDLAEIAFRYTFKRFMERVRKGQLLFLRWMRPDLLIHPLHAGSAQITGLEMRTLYDIGLRCGVHSVHVYLGPELNDLFLRTGHYVTA
jgi:hypothetical protein